MQRNIFLHLLCLPLVCQLLFFLSTTRGNTGVMRGGGGGGGVASREMCFSHVHIKHTWQTALPQRLVGYPPGPIAQEQWETFLTCWGFMYPKTIQWGYPCLSHLFSSFYWHKGNIFHTLGIVFFLIVFSLRWESTCLFIRHGICLMTHHTDNDTIRHHSLQWILELNCMFQCCQEN